MFDFAWSELALIGVVALILIGPKDLPVALKGITELIKKARRMAAEFQTHVDDMMKDADLKEMSKSLKELRSFDLKGEITKAVDGDGSIRKALNDDPLGTNSIGGSMSAGPDADASGVANYETETLDQKQAAEAADLSRPAFVPPGIVKPPKMLPRPDFVPPHYADIPRDSASA